MKKIVLVPVFLLVCLFLVMPVLAATLSERAINGQFDDVKITYEQWMAGGGMGSPPWPTGWTQIGDEGVMYWIPNYDWEPETGLHATYNIYNGPDHAGLKTTLNAIDGQYIRIILDDARNDPLVVYLDDIEIGTVQGAKSVGQFDISNRQWTSTSVLKVVTATDVELGTTTLIRSISLKGYDVDAAFSSTPLSGPAPLEVSFTDESTGDPTSWYWEFGDNEISTLQNPHHIYTNQGTYTVSLTTTNAGGSDTEIKTGYVVVTAGATPTPVTKTFSTTDAVDPEGVNGQGQQTVHYIEDRLEHLGWTQKFSLHDPEVTKESLGINGDIPENNLNHATLHWHVGHGAEDGHLWLRKNGDLLTSEVAGKWGYQNKWVVLDSCSALQNDKWKNALNGTHGILGFTTISYVRSTLAQKFFDYAVNDGLSVYQAFRLATIDEYKGVTVPIGLDKDGKPNETGPRESVSARVIFANESQALNDHLPGIGPGIQPDGLPDDDFYMPDPWSCG
jgi:PKD repeat protein